MSHIPASKMPHAKPHADHDEHDEHAPAASTPDTSAPPKPSKGEDHAEPAPAPGTKPAPVGAGSSLPFIAIAAVGAVAIGGIVAALALRHPEPASKPAKPGDKRKGRGRKGRDEA